MPLPHTVTIVEVGPRDGLQNEAHIIPTAIKIDFINQLSETGLRVIETTSFVSPKWIPQLADHVAVFQGITKKDNIAYPVLIPNLVGLQRAMVIGVKDIAVFTTPSEMFSQKNTHCSVAESLQRIKEITTVAKEQDIRIRGYLSCVLGCPYQGEILPEAVLEVAEQLIQLGCYEVSLGDTIGVGTKDSVKALLDVLIKKIPVDQLAVHFHDTYGRAIENIHLALTYGIHVIDSSVSGLGGCPYAKGATGNVATEKVLVLLQELGINTDVDIAKINKVSHFIRNFLKNQHDKTISPDK